ncbi:MAG: hypothetical protein NTW50_04165 [Candidatus Berkelbacteria bacterium]|nr:hypothetical protein [Candidatus Berkelbacteria bacterium]
MKRAELIVIIAVVAVIILAALLFLRGDEDTWIKDGRGVWIAHGKPSQTPDEVKQQQDAIQLAEKFFDNSKKAGQDFSAGPCLGVFQTDWVLDVVHNPRDKSDDEAKNQCAAYNSGQAHHFIEMDLTGQVVRVQ